VEIREGADGMTASELGEGRLSSHPGHVAEKAAAR
jgi:hypothetical protein